LIARGALVLEVQILDVERQHFLRASGTLIKQPPEGFLAHRDVVASPEPIELRVRDRLGPVGRLAAALKPVGERRGLPAASAAERRERAQRCDVPVPCGRRRLTPRLERGAFELPGADAIKRPLDAKRLLEPAERLCVGAAARRREVRLGEERVDRVGQWRGWSARRPQVGSDA